MSEIEYFENLDDFFKVLRQREDTALAGASDEQKLIGHGDCFENISAMPRFGFPVYGEIFTEEQFAQMERDCGAEEPEIEFELSVLRQAYMRGYRHGRCYSAWEPDGEIGDTHISVMRKISREEFEAAMERGWR